MNMFEMLRLGGEARRHPRSRQACDEVSVTFNPDIDDLVWRIDGRVATLDEVERWVKP